MNIIRKVLAPSRLTPALKGVLIAGVVCLALMVPAPSRADHDQDQHLAVTQPTPPPKDPLLNRLSPSLKENRATWDPFFRDADLRVRFRSFYFNRQNDTGNDSEAWALGGWAQFSSGWLLDTFQIGGAYFTSLPAYAPDDRPGSQLLTPGQDAIGVFAEAWAALRYKEYVLLKGGRTRVEEAFINSQDNRMLPNTFEAVTLSGHVDWLRYDVGYVWTIKPRDSNDFISMSRQAGGTGDDEGMFFGAVELTPIKGLVLYAGNFYTVNTFNTFFVKGEYLHQLTNDLGLQFGLQFTDQTDVGDAQVGAFNTWNVGLGARLLWRGLTVGVAAHFNSDEADLRTNYGSWAGYLSLQVTDFDRANEKAFGIGVKYDFGGTLLPFQLPGFKVHLLYARGADRINPVSGANQPTTHEGDLDFIYDVPQVKGLQFRFRNAYIGRGNDKIVKDFRIIINYELDLF